MDPWNGRTVDEEEEEEGDAEEEEEEEEEMNKGKKTKARKTKEKRSFLCPIWGSVVKSKKVLKPTHSIAMSSEAIGKASERWQRIGNSVRNTERLVCRLARSLAYASYSLDRQQSLGSRSAALFCCFLRLLVNAPKYRVILKKVSFGVFKIILVSEEEQIFTIESKGKGLSLNEFS